MPDQTIQASDTADLNTTTGVGRPSFDFKASFADIRVLSRDLAREIRKLQRDDSSLTRVLNRVDKLEERISEVPPICEAAHAGADLDIKFLPLDRALAVSLFAIRALKNSGIEYEFCYSGIPELETKSSEISRALLERARVAATYTADTILACERRADGTQTLVLGRITAADLVDWKRTMEE